MKLLTSFILGLWLVSANAGSLCGKISDLRTPMDDQNNEIQSVVIITR